MRTQQITEQPAGNFPELFDLLGQLARRRYLAGEKAFASLGLNHTEARLLRALGQADGPQSQDSLSAVLGVDRSNATRALLRLETAALIERQRVDSDKRRNLVQLTRQGRKAAADIRRLRADLIQGFFGAMTEDEAGKAVALLRKAVGNE